MAVDCRACNWAWSCGEDLVAAADVRDEKERERRAVAHVLGEKCIFVLEPEFGCCL